jgi:hypothetical protein
MKIVSGARLHHVPLMYSTNDATSNSSSVMIARKMSPIDTMPTNSPLSTTGTCRDDALLPVHAVRAQRDVR